MTLEMISGNNMTNGTLLWVDDEIEQLKAQILFLEKKGYDITTVTNGNDAIELCQEQSFDLVLLDEQMPGLSGLEVLQSIKTGDTLNLQREENKFDDMAILILNEAGQKLGYVPEKDNIVFARLMDAGKLLSAKVEKIELVGTFSKIAISIFLVDF